jgi:hypothetical protein
VEQQTLAEADYFGIRKLVSVGALCPIKPSILPQSGFVAVVCPDGDNTPEMFRHFGDVCTESNGGPVCLHLAPVTGGPGAIPSQSPMYPLSFRGNQWGNARDLVYTYIEAALKVKGNRLRNIALVPHAPCGMVCLCGLSVWENLDLAFQAKDEIRKEFRRDFESFKVLTHVNYAGHDEVRGPGGQFRTYLLRRDPFYRALEEHKLQERRKRCIS